MEDYKNSALPTAQRVEDLLARMTLKEKVAQLSGIWAYEVLKSSRFDAGKAAEKMGEGLGQITRLGGAGLQKPETAAQTANEIQRYMKDKTRLGIPVLIHEEACSGYLTRGANVFPQAIGVGSSFDPSIARRMGEIIREQMLALGARQALAPLLDVTRDPRWGRTEETYGEDRYLTSRMGVAYIQGLQGEDPKQGIVATGKHFAGYGNSEGGMNWAPAHIPPRELAETFLYPFEVAVKEAKLQSIMPAYNELDGVPCHTNVALLRTKLRDEWGFDGIIVSDYFGINMVHDYHRTTADKKAAAHLALAAGVDVELPSTDCYGAPLVEAVEKGQVPLALVEQSVRRVLAMKFDLGLFENPFVEPSQVTGHFQTEDQRAFSRQAAQKSIILLKNNGVLPLSATKKRVAVIGPNADSVRNMLGDYTFPAHAEALLDMKTDNFASTPVPDDLTSLEDELPAMDSVLQGLRKAAPAVEFVHAQGCEVIGGTQDGFREAVAAASSAELIIAVMGDKAGLIEGCTSGEARDRANLDLPGHQKELLKALVATGKPVVLVLVSGRPLTLTWENDHVAAIVEAWLPGEEGAAAIASVLFGASPAGRTPLSFPRSVGQIPVFYGHKPSGGRSHWKGDYVDESNKPLYPFGYGLSYTSFAYSDLAAPATLKIGGDLEVSFTVKNTGKVASDEVPQLYVHDLLADITRPVLELIGFSRIGLAPGESKRVTFRLSTEQLGFYDREMAFVVEPGETEILVGSSSQDIRLKTVCTLEGNRRSFPRRHFETRVTVS